MTEEQRCDATQIRDFTTEGKPVGALIEGQQGRPWQVLRLAEARAVLVCVLGHGDAEAAWLRRDAVSALRAAKVFGRADAMLARCR